jgi:transposase
MTEKQTAALDLLRQGRSNRQIAACLPVSQRTIETWSPALRAALAQESTSVAAPKDAAPSEAHTETPAETLERIQRTIEKTTASLTALDAEARLVAACRFPAGRHRRS